MSRKGKGRTLSAFEQLRHRLAAHPKTSSARWIRCASFGFSRAAVCGSTFDILRCSAASRRRRLDIDLRA